jgi:isoquinoline 1-oxidoreductase alpha subunit
VASIKFTLNGKPQTVDAVPEMPLLWVLRDTLHLTGTKFGCGMALCGACTVHINGDAPMAAIPSSRPGWNRMFRSAATASPDRS